MLVELRPAELAAHSHENLVAHYELLARVAPAGDAAVIDGVVATRTGLLEPEFNRCFVVDPPRDPGRLIAGLAAFYREGAVPWMLVATPEAAPAISEAATAAGLAFGRPISALAAGIEGIAARAVPGLDVERVTSAALAEIFVAALAEGYGTPREFLGLYALPGAWDVGEIESYIGWYQGEPAGTVTCIATPDVAGIYNVSTAARWRNRGIGSALTAHAVAEARATGCSATALQASAMGFRMYRRLGYEPIGSYRAWYWFHRS